MKKVLQLVALAVIGMLITGSYGAEAANYKKVTKVVKVVTKKVTKKTQALALQLDSGRRVHLDLIVKRRFKKKRVSEILKRAQIELKSGEVIYPEEVKYALVKKTNFVRVIMEGRAPRGDDE